MESIDLHKLVENSELDLTTISTTSSYKGHSRDVQTAIIGFNNFEEAKKFAKENKLDIIRVERRDGWDLWSRGGLVYKELEPDKCWNGYSPKGFNAREFFADIVKDELADTETLDDAIKCLNYYKSVIEAIERAYDDEFVISNGSDIGILKSHCMHYSWDTHEYAIALIKSLKDKQ